MDIRPFAEPDRAGVVALWRRAGLTRPWNDPDRDIDRKLAVQPDLLLVGAEGGRIVATAMAGYDGHRGSLYYLAVDPERQGAGLGRAMMAHVEALLLARGCPKLNIPVRSDNAPARGFYAALGYAHEAVDTWGKRLIGD